METKRYKYSKLFKDIYTFRGFKYSTIENQRNLVHIYLKRTRKTAVCRKCGKRNPLRNESYTRTICDLDLGPKKCYITFSEVKLHCHCGHRGYETIDFTRPYSHCTKRYEEFVYRLTERMTISDVVMITGLDWKTVKDIDKYYIKKRLVELQDLNPVGLGIDEIAYEKGHKYLTVVRDLDLNCVIWIGLGRKKETLDAFFTLLGEEKQRLIAVVVLDMWDPYIASVKEYCPSADIVIDKFHIIKKVNEAVDAIRKQEFAKAKEEERIQMKRKRFIILKRGKNLTERQQEKLQELMENNELLYKAYLLKEQISDIFDEEGYESAMERLHKWIENVNESDISSFKKVVKTLRRYSYGVHNYFRYHITNAGSEGFNTKINIIRRKAYGFWDLEYFKLKIFQSCGVMRLDPT